MQQTDQQHTSMPYIVIMDTKLAELQHGLAVATPPCDFDGVAHVFLERAYELGQEEGRTNPAGEGTDSFNPNRTGEENSER
jgi:hypothetical protein